MKVAGNEKTLAYYKVVQLLPKRMHSRLIFKGNLGGFHWDLHSKNISLGWNWLAVKNTLAYYKVVVFRVQTILIFAGNLGAYH